MTETNQHYDLVIVGGGLVGMSLAVALADAPLSILLLEQNQVAPVNANSLDLRTTGLTRSSERVFSTAGIWPLLQPHATPIERLEISELGAFGCARIDGKRHGISPIGYMLPNHALILALSEKVTQCKNVCVQTPASLQALRPTDRGVELQVDVNGQMRTCSAALVVGADGANSKVRELLDFNVKRKDYGQSAIITNVLPQFPHRNTAYERFTEVGPLAVLPIQNDHCALIWTHASESVSKYIDLDDGEFLQRLQSEFGYRLGKFLQVGKRAAYPLSLTVSEALCASNAVLLGNAAQSVHPVAAQGLNLGLRDVQALVELMKKYQFNIGDYAQMLTEYEQIRSADRNHVIRLTDGLTRIFAIQAGPLKSMRGCGIRAIGALPAVQRTLLRRNLGMRYFTNAFG